MIFNEQGLRAVLEGGGGFGGAVMRGILKIPGLAYGAAMACRRRAYESGAAVSYRASVPVVSVGNVTAGGSGKTPMALLLCREFLAMGTRPGILLRGYRASAGHSDEAGLYRTLCPEAIVEEGADRVAAAERAVLRGARVLVMDDGFQHLRLRRDLDIVLVDALSPWGGGVPIPGGLLREPVSALARADALVVTRSDQVSRPALEQIQAALSRLSPRAEQFAARHRASRLATLDGRTEDLASLKGRKVLALCGIARPESFVLTLQGLGAKVIKLVAVGDHREFSRGTLAGAERDALSAGAVPVVTEKDAARKNFRRFADNTIRAALVLGVEQELDKPEAMRVLLRNALGRRRG